jgi:hypothetical protein
MKSFSQFWEEADSSKRSPEGQREARLAEISRAKGEAKRRREHSKSVTQRHREEMYAKQREAPETSSTSQSNTERPMNIVPGVRRALKKSGKALFKGIKKVLKDRKDNS